MAKKTVKKEEIEEKVEEKTEETPETPDTQDIDYKKDIEGKSFEQVAADTPNDNEKPKEEEKDTKDEKPADDKKEEEYEEVEFDPEKLKEEAKSEARKEMADLLAGKDTSKQEEIKDEYEEFVDNYTKEHGQAPDWKVVAGFIKEQAKNELKAEQEQEAKEQAEKVEAEKKAQDERQASVDKYVDDQFEQIYQTGKFPRIQNDKDENDLGVKFRKALADQTIQINKERLDKGLPTKTLVEVFFTEFKAPNQQPAGFDAPVSAGRSGGTPENQEELNYARDVRGKSFFDILMRRN